MAQVPIVRIEDNRKGIIVSILFLLITLFLLFFIKYHEPDPPKVTVPVPIIMAESGIEDFEVSNAGGGSPSENVNPVPDPQPSPKEQATQKEESPVKVPSGKGNSNSQTNSQQESESSPFSGSGSGGQGSGSGGGFGNDTGPGSGGGDPGTGGAGERVRLNNLRSNPDTPNDQHATIALKLIVDSRGAVVAASVIRDKTTTSNQRLIDEVISLVKKEVKYKEKPGARNETVYYTVKVTPN
ncbi:MAG: hypothetical protein R3277_04705 [Brumimicrobium sp.]|nr:hypothetical protein [Brumimicrobium sp.]